MAEGLKLDDLSGLFQSKPLSDFIITGMTVEMESILIKKYLENYVYYRKVSFIWEGM